MVVSQQFEQILKSSEIIHKSYAAPYNSVSNGQADMVLQTNNNTYCLHLQAVEHQHKHYKYKIIKIPKLFEATEKNSSLYHWSNTILVEPHLLNEGQLHLPEKQNK